MQVDIDIEKIRGLLEGAVRDTKAYSVCVFWQNPNFLIVSKYDFDQALSLLPKPCSTCGGSGRKIIKPIISQSDFPRSAKFAPQLPQTEPCPACQPAGEVEKYKEIPLTQGKVALVDPEDYERLNQFKWRAKKDAHTFYAVRQEGAYPRKFFYMHREILNPPNGCGSDHINGDGLDNRKANLRICTASQNQHNQKINDLRGSSKYKGVCWHKAVEKWAAYIKANKKLIHLGYFQNETEAAEAYDSKAKELFGEFAKLNFPNNCQSSPIKIEEFVKKAKPLSNCFINLENVTAGAYELICELKRNLNQACTHLTAQAKTIEQLRKGDEYVAAWMDEAQEAKEGNAILKAQIEQLEGEKESLKAGLLIDARRFAEQKEQIKQLSECIVQLEAENRWIPVGERLPELPVSIHNESSGLLWLIAKDKPCQGYYNNFEGWRICGRYQNASEYQREVTHWKPIILPDEALQKGE